MHMTARIQEVIITYNSYIRIYVATNYSYAELMIMASHQTFSGQVKHLSGQTKFGQTSLLYIINGEVIKFTKENKCPDNFQSLS